MNADRHYDIIRSVYVSEKVTALNECNKYVFCISQSATKLDLKRTIEFLYDVKVLSINVMNTKGKKKRFKGTLGVRSSFKKAIVTFGQNVNFDLNAYN
jgi:large subunit ribosomal protein L23